MTTSANITPQAPTDGILYATGVPLTPTEATLGDALVTPAIIPTEFGQAIVAVVQLTVAGLIVASSAYVVMQMDMGDGVWVDVNWCFWNGSQGSATFVFSNGIAGANSFQQSRASGAIPVTSAGVQGNGSNQLTLGGRIRFVGKATPAGGSSNVAGTASQVTATIRYKLLGLR